MWALLGYWVKSPCIILLPSHFVDEKTSFRKAQHCIELQRPKESIKFLKPFTSPQFSQRGTSVQHSGKSECGLVGQDLSVNAGRCDNLSWLCKKKSLLFLEMNIGVCEGAMVPKVCFFLYLCGCICVYTCMCVHSPAFLPLSMPSGSTTYFNMVGKGSWGRSPQTPQEQSHRYIT